MRVLLAVLFLLAALLPAQERPELPTAESMYKQSCAPCHDTGAGGAPQRQVLRAMSPEHVLDAMENGQMVRRWEPRP